ncbi:tetratricopeptide repeat protein [Nannocystaceae bacterium ST9]
MTEHPNEPMPVRPALRAFVEAARAQPIAPTRLSAHEVQRAWAADRRERKTERKLLAVGVSIGLAAAALVGLITTSLGAWIDGPSEPDEIASSVEPDSPSSIETPPVASLDPAIRVRSAADESPRVLGPWSIALERGHHEIAVEPSPGHALRIDLPDARALELVHGALTLDFVERGAVVRLESGIAAWIEVDGTRTQIAVERIELDTATSEAEVEAEPTPRSSEPSASELARAAERQLLAGSRADAIATLRKLVRKYPRTPQARTALMDLAAQERLAGSPDRARCAYQLYLERWPHSEVRSEIDKQLAKLGQGPACRGLDPR